MNLNHPFALDISDLEDLNLDVGKQLTDEEAAEIGGGKAPEVTTLALGEEGGHDHPGEIVCISAPCPGSESGGEPSPKPLPKPPKPPVYTKAWFENGGGVYTKALHENGGSIYE
ncbi:MAG: hypothetical protein RMX68_008905 [Aulosira sp. ZfuVER01]|nr:hypothetical protein [Aulosira sp. ZfuVER01]MDZ7998673.1 hypothetical protein [Aulosira sp. DedVER01a]MDZ8054845.1 hypothetical protein [Aulosira sp. ZfuCHP01]